ncbi:LacI family transcriptional regulator [bacterium]|nr:MAG: LacI family transcriptional regulator [bacterium]
MSRARLIDIARAAGVSMTTASYVINQRSVAIPLETRQRIFRIAQDLNYLPNRMARNLAQKTSGLIGVLSPLNGSPFHARLVAELHAYAAEQSYKLVFESDVQEAGDLAARQNAIERLLQWRVDGLILWSEDRIPVVDADCPIVSIGQVLANAASPHHVTIDLYRSAQLATRHLIEIGHSDLCFVGHSEHDPDLRWTAVCDEAAKAGLPIPTRLLAPSDIPQNEELPTAFVCISDVQALQVFRVLRDRGLKVPENVSLASCDETWAAANLDPPLTAVSIPFQNSTKRALDLLLARIDGREAPDAEIAAPVLTVRGSTGSPR